MSNTVSSRASHDRRSPSSSSASPLAAPVEGAVLRLVGAPSPRLVDTNRSRRPAPRHRPPTRRTGPIERHAPPCSPCSTG